MMFKTKERDIDKANIRLAVLEWQLKELMEMYGESIGDVRRLQKELREYKELEPKLQKEVDRLHLLLQERRHLEFGLGRDERKRLSDKIYQIQTEYDVMAGLNSKLSYEHNTLLKDKNKLEKKNQGLELDIEGMNGDYSDIVTECCDLIHEREGFLRGKRPLDEDKKGFIERETRIISRTELMIILEDYYKVTEVELGEVRVGTPIHYISTVPLTACSSQLVNIQIAYRKKVDKE